MFISSSTLFIYIYTYIYIYMCVCVLHSSLHCSIHHHVLDDCVVRAHNCIWEFWHGNQYFLLGVIKVFNWNKSINPWKKSMFFRVKSNTYCRSTCFRVLSPSLSLSLANSHSHSYSLSVCLSVRLSVCLLSPSLYIYIPLPLSPSLSDTRIWAQ